MLDRWEPTRSDCDDRQQHNSEGQRCQVVGFSPKSMAVAARPASSASAVPKTTPANSMAAVSRMTSAITWPRLRPARCEYRSHSAAG